MNVSAVLPWELHPALQLDRLVSLAKVAVETRNRAFAEADRAAGDTNWGLACKAHERLMFALTRLAEGGTCPWLTVNREGLYLMPLVEDVPVRLFRGAADHVSSRHLDAVRFEYERVRANDTQTAFSFMAATESESPWYWLMAMETDAAGMVSRVVYFQANDAGEARHQWECPLEDRREEEVPPPVVRLVEPAAPAAPVTVSAPDPAPAAPAPALFALEPAESQAPRKRSRRAAKSAAPAVDTRQEELWSTAIGAE
jgi:hypothetical protein